MVKDNEDYRLPRGSNTIADDVVCLLEASPHVFHLGGSYFFGCARPDSDVDFIAQDTGALEDWLEENGFRPMAKGTYEGYDMVWEHRTGPVQVSVTPYLAQKLIARDVLAKYFSAEHRGASKPQRNQAWSRLIEAMLNVTADLVGPEEVLF